MKTARHREVTGTDAHARVESEPKGDFGSVPAADAIAEPMAKPIRILMVDDHPLVRVGLKTILSEYGLPCVIGEAGSGVEALEKLRESHWDIVLLDIAMPGMSGVDTLKSIKHANPDVPVLILSMYAEQQYAVNLLRAGAGGYICKEVPSAQLVDAILTVARGLRYVSGSFAEGLLAGLIEDRPRPLHASLSDREFQVFCKLVAGRAVKQIAGDLGLSAKTVSTYRSRILAKLKMASTAELTFYATKIGLLR